MSPRPASRILRSPRLPLGASWCAAVSLLLLTGGQATQACKYSVRDLAFVNIHGSPWQLVAIRPDDTAEPSELEEWQTTMDRELSGANVELQWFSAANAAGARVNALFPTDVDSAAPRIALVGPEDRIAQVWPPVTESKTDFESTLRSVVQSPLRAQILDQAAAALCVFVVVQGNEQSDEVHQTVKSAAEQLSRQMWTLDKAPREGPQVVVVPAEARRRERWMLWSLGIEPAAPNTTVAVVYGQGRCLGQPLDGAELTASQLVEIGSICGRDCECDLDRAWLYGAQMLHVWNDARERLAESSLDFDPNSAMVLVEASRILQRNGSTHQRTSSAPPASGLVIHDLPSLEDESNPRTEPPQSVASPVRNERSGAAEKSATTTTEAVDTFGGARLAAVALCAVVLLMGIYAFRRRAQ